MLTADEIAAMRATENDALPDTCTIQTRTATNTKGSVADSYANTYTGVSCRLGATNYKQVEKDIGAALASQTDYTLTLKNDQACSPTDRVVHNGVTYEVVGVPNDKASWLFARRAYLKRTQ